MRQVPGWLEYFMILAQAVAIRSKDPATQVGCVVVNSDNHIVGTGYNGFEPGAAESPEMWERPTKYEHVKHAEANALEHLTVESWGMRLFSTMYPCAECAAKIARSGIVEVFYLDDKYRNFESETIFREAAIKVTKLTK